jgi:multiple antibiotic resistance protein
VQTSDAGGLLPEDFGVVPLGMPLIAGPALITTLLLLAQTPTIGVAATLTALVVNLVLVIAALAYSEWFGGRIGRTGLKAISKIIAMLLAAIAVAMIRRGLGV